MFRVAKGSTWVGPCELSSSSWPSQSQTSGVVAISQFPAFSFWSEKCATTLETDWRLDQTHVDTRLKMKTRQIKRVALYFNESASRLNVSQIRRRKILTSNIQNIGHVGVDGVKNVDRAGLGICTLKLNGNFQIGFARNARTVICERH